MLEYWHNERYGGHTDANEFTNSSKTLSRRFNVFLIKRVVQCSQFHQFTNRVKQRYRSIYLTSLRVSAWILFSVILTDRTLGEKSDL